MATSSEFDLGVVAGGVEPQAANARHIRQEHVEPGSGLTLAPFWITYAWSIGHLLRFSVAPALAASA
jgi:hypothetical protein